MEIPCNSRYVGAYGEKSVKPDAPTLQAPPEFTAPMTGVPVRRACALFLILAFVLMFGLSMHKRLDHDEHQFIAPAALFLRRGLIPYRDYPYFHTPYLVFINAGLFALTDHLLLAARLLEMLASFGTICFLLIVNLRTFHAQPPKLRTMLAIGLTVLVLANPIFTLTSGRSWNHDLPTFLMLLALAALQGAGGERRRPRTLLALAAGLLMGIATGVRLTFAPPALAMMAWPYVADHLALRKRWQLALTYSAGVVVALIPVLVIFWLAPQRFLFGNFTYPFLNTAFRDATSFGKGMTGLGKLWFVVTDVLSRPGCLALTVLFVATLVLAWPLRRRMSRHDRREAGLLIFLLCIVLIGTFAPSPLFAIYFFEAIPLMALLIALGASAVALDPERFRFWLKWFVVPAVALTFVVGLPAFRGVFHLGSRHGWVPLRMHDVGERIARAVPPNTTVLTVAPLLPLEGGRDVFEEFATGPFALRVSPAITESQEQRFHFFDEDDFLAMMVKRRPAALLTGHEGAMDDAMLDAMHGMPLTARDVGEGYTLWVPQPNYASVPPASTARSEDDSGTAPPR